MIGVYGENLETGQALGVHRREEDGPEEHYDEVLEYEGRLKREDCPFPEGERRPVPVVVPISVLPFLAERAELIDQEENRAEGAQVDPPVGEEREV